MNMFYTSSLIDKTTSPLWLPAKGLYFLHFVVSFFSMLEQSHWLDYISQLLRVSNELVEAIAVKHQPVLVHCSDGWDRTSQVVSLAELLLDPYYRTIKVRCGWGYFHHMYFSQRAFKF